MLEIHQKKDIMGYTGYLWDYQLDAADAKIVEAFDKEKVIGFCLFSYTDDCVHFYHISYGNDIYLFDGIIRAVLFKASLKGIDKALYLFNDIETLELLDKFKTVDLGKDTLSSIQNVMNGCKNCKNSS